MAVVAADFNLVANACCMELRVEARGFEEQVPPRKEHAEVVPAQHRAWEFVTNANGVVKAMKAWADHETLQPRPPSQAHIGMLQVLAQLSERHPDQELAGLNANQQSHPTHHRGVEDVIEQVVAVVGPGIEVTLRVMKRMQSPKRFPLVLQAVVKVIDRIQNDLIDEKAHPTLIGHTGPNLVDAESGQARQAQCIEARLNPRLQ